VKQPKYPFIPKDLPMVAWHPWTDLRHRDDIKRLNISFPFGIMPDKWTLKIKQGYYAAARYIDDLVGDLVTHVDLNNTILVLTSDHGKYNCPYLFFFLLLCHCGVGTTCFSSCCDKGSAIILATGRLPDINPP
jgi:hypothetical protein